MSAARELLLVRHPKVSVSGICYGHADVPAPLDDDDVETLLAKLPPLGAVWTSPLGRCADLARRIAERRGLALQTNGDLRELGFGDFEGLSWSEIEARFPREYARWMGDWQRTPPPGGETLTAFSERVERALSAIAATQHAATHHSETHHSETECAGSTLVVTHAGVIRTLLRLTNGSSWDDALSAPVPHMDPVVFRWPVQTSPGP